MGRRWPLLRAPLPDGDVEQGRQRGQGLGDEPSHDEGEPNRAETTKRVAAWPSARSNTSLGSVGGSPVAVTIPEFSRAL